MGGSGGRKIMIGLINLYKILSLGLSYPEEKNWAMIERQLTMAEDLFEGEILSSIVNFGEYFSENRRRIDEIKSAFDEVIEQGVYGTV